MKTILLLALLASYNTNAADCVDIWQFFDGHDWIHITTNQMRLYIEPIGNSVMVKNITYYNVPVRKLRVCNQKQKEQANERN